MAIIRFSDKPFFRNPWAEFEKMRRDMDNMMQGIAADTGAGGGDIFPPLNISEDNDNIYVRAEVPGINPAAFNISVEGNTLIIKGERACATDRKASYHRREIECGQFSRAVTLPTKVDVEKVDAEGADGILTIILPKAAEAKPRQITVNVG